MSIQQQRQFMQAAALTGLCGKFFRHYSRHALNKYQ